MQKEIWKQNFNDYIMHDLFSQVVHFWSYETLKFIKKALQSAPKLLDLLMISIKWSCNPLSFNTESILLLQNIWFKNVSKRKNVFYNLKSLSHIQLLFGEKLKIIEKCILECL